ncbi:MAG: damage-inducible protein DinB [Gammaproteobacteria bacterium]|nr:damage-inducible protein DinB [Gammaproteobacteria bacterium]
MPDHRRGAVLALDIFTTMAQYNRWMNGRLYAVCAEIPDAERKRDRGAFFKSIHGTLNHLLLGDRLWLGRFLHRPFPVDSLDQDLYPDFDELRAEREGTDQEILDFSGSLDEEALARDFRFTTIVDPGEHVFPFRHVLQQFFNHQTHHRGQVTTLIKQAGYEPGVTDLMWLPGVEQ